jgi:predicted dehydrogenase
MKQGRTDFDNGSLSAFPADAIHCVDLVRSIAAGSVVEVATVVQRIDAPIDNSWNSVFQFDNGVIGTIRSNYRTGGRVHGFEVFGPGVSAFINLGFGRIACEATVILGGKGQGYSYAATGNDNVEILQLDGLELAGSRDFHKFYGYYQEDEDFVRSVQHGTAPLCTIKDAAQSFRMVDQLLAGVPVGGRLA